MTGSEERHELAPPPDEIILPGSDADRRRQAAGQIILALDFSNALDAQAVVDEFGDTVTYKIGMELAEALAASVFTVNLDELDELETGQVPPEVMDNLLAARRLYRSVRGTAFKDTKFIDIPPSVAGAVKNVVCYQPRMINVMAVGGRAMIEAAVKARDEAVAALHLTQKPLIIAVTWLTSLDAADMAELGFTVPPNLDDPEVREALAAATVQEQVVRLAKLAQSAGADGVVCSPWETAAVREACGPDFEIVNPSIRLVAQKGAQKRTATPAEATTAGCNSMVVGTEVTKAKDSMRAGLDRVIDNILTALP